MTEKHRQYGLSPNVRTRPATVPAKRCSTCGTRAAVQRRDGLFCVYCSAPAIAATTDEELAAWLEPPAPRR